MLSGRRNYIVDSGLQQHGQHFLGSSSGLKSEFEDEGYLTLGKSRGKNLKPFKIWAFTKLPKSVPKKRHPIFMDERAEKRSGKWSRLFRNHLSGTQDAWSSTRRIANVLRVVNFLERQRKIPPNRIHFGDNALLLFGRSDRGNPRMLVFRPNNKRKLSASEMRKLDSKGEGNRRIHAQPGRGHRRRRARLVPQESYTRR